MERKPILKSKTVNSALVIIVIVALNLLGVGEAELGATYDTWTKTEGSAMETAKELTTLAAAGLAIYGRMKAKTTLGKGGDDESV